MNTSSTSPVQSNKASPDTGKDLHLQQTHWAEDRTVLSNERTFASWMRTGMTSIGVALGLKALFHDTDHPIIAKSVAEVFILVAVLIFWAALSKARKAQQRMSCHDVQAESLKRMFFLAVLLTLAAIVTGIILWLL